MNNTVAVTLTKEEAQRVCFALSSILGGHAIKEPYRVTAARTQAFCARAYQDRPQHRVAIREIEVEADLLQRFAQQLEPEVP